ncbi:MAG: restriction endonuclease subunit S [Truepera sp.]|nr:restriction endonuclease subunit S [Truepera sp.]
MIDLNPNHLGTVKAILAEHVPECEVRAFGSRATWTAKDYSDLDLAILGKGPLDWTTLGRLKEAFEESDLPMRVDVLDWHTISGGFREVIEREHLVLVAAASKSLDQQDSGMKAEWQETSLGELIELKRGYDLPQRNRSPGPFPLVSSSGVTDYQAAAKVAGPGVVTGRYGTLGKVFFVPEDFWPLNTTLYVRDFKGNDPRFISYFLRSIDLSPYSDKAAVPGLNRNHLHQAQVRFPAEVEEQRTIAQILGTLDDKIELNRQLNETLEGLARAIFKDWFVDFGPVRAKLEGRDTGLPEQLAELFPDRLVESELGEIPEGWEAASLETAIEIHDKRRIPLNRRQRTERQGPYPYYGAAGIVNYVDDYLFDGVHVLVGEDGSVVDARGHPVIQYVWGKFWVNNHAHVLKGRGDISDEVLYLLLQRTNITAFVTGAVQPKLNQKNLKAIPLVLPPSPICRAFSGLIAPLFARVRHSADESERVAALRDTLFPQLISGEIRVPDAERVVESVT